MMALPTLLGATGVIIGEKKSATTPGKTHVFDRTRLCKFFAKGQCHRGESCTFAHGDHELMPQPDFYKTQLCVEYFRAGSCKSGAGCRYAHDPLEIRRSRVAKRQQQQQALPRCPPSGSVVGVVQAQLQILRAQSANALASPDHFGGVTTHPPHEMAYDDGFQLLKGQLDWQDEFCSGLSRQSTEEGVALESSFSRQTTQNIEIWTPLREEVSDDEMVCDEEVRRCDEETTNSGDDAPSGVAHAHTNGAPSHRDSGDGTCYEDISGYRLVVRRSFLAMVPTGPGTEVRRRSKSEPPQGTSTEAEPQAAS